MGGSNCLSSKICQRAVLSRNPCIIKEIVMIKMHCSCPLQRSFERVEDHSLSALVQRVCGTVGEALKHLSYVVFLAGVVGCSVIALADPFAAAFGIPLYLIMGGSLTYLIGAVLQGLSGRSFIYY